MPAQKRYKTKYPGVYYIKGRAVGSSKTERIYYIMYRRDGKQIHEKAGRTGKDDMTPARAAGVRSDRIEGKDLPNKKKREIKKAAQEAEIAKWTIERLWDEYKKNKPKLKGIVTDQNRFDNHIESNFGKREPSEIVPLDVDRVRLRLAKKRAPATVKNVLELLRRIINFGVKKNLCEGLNFTIEMPVVDNLKTEDLDTEQLKNLLKAIEEDKHPHAGPIMKMALFTGMRRGEIFKLKWSDVNFSKGFINLVDPKGGPDQKIPLNDASGGLIESIPRTRSKYVFPGRRGKRRTDINKAVNEIKTAAKLPKSFRPLHGLRHVYASMLASSGEVDLYTLQKLLGHKSSAMTERYAHLRDDALRRASDIAGTIIEQAAKSAKEDKKKVVNIEDHS